jgi:cullin 3
MSILSDLIGSLTHRYTKVEKRLASEQSRTHHYLSSTTHTPLKRILESTLLTPHLHTIITLPNSGLDAMIDHLNFPSLSRLHTLFTMVPEGLQVLKKALKESIAVRGKEVNEMEGGDGDGGDAEEEGEGEDHGGGGKGKGKERAPPISGKQSSAAALKWVADVLELKDKFDRILKTCFKNDIVIQSAINEVWFLVRKVF